VALGKASTVSVIATGFRKDSSFFLYKSIWTIECGMDDAESSCRDWQFS